MDATWGLLGAFSAMLTIGTGVLASDLLDRSQTRAHEQQEALQQQRLTGKLPPTLTPPRVPKLPRMLKSQ